MSTNKKIYFLCFILSFIIYIFLPTNFFITRLFVIFPLLFLGAFLFSSNKKKLATSVVNFFTISQS